MAYKKKYRKGKQINSFEELLKQKWVYCHHKITHIKWVKSWQISLAEMYIARGNLFYAIKESEVELNGDQKEYGGDDSHY